MNLVEIFLQKSCPDQKQFLNKCVEIHKLKHRVKFQPKVSANIALTLQC